MLQFKMAGSWRLKIKLDIKESGDILVMLRANHHNGTSEVREDIYSSQSNDIFSKVQL